MKKSSSVLLNTKNAEKHLLKIVIYSFLYCLLSILISLWILPDYSSILAIFLTIFPSIYIIEKALIIEEKRDKSNANEKRILKGHAKLIKLLLSIFLGFLIAFTLVSIVLPTDTVNKIFDAQKNSISVLTANAVSNSGSLSLILQKNLKVFLVSLIFAAFYGAGVIFILAWNASIMGFVIGTSAVNKFGLQSLPALLIKYFIHGIPEMLAYFGAALAGGIIFIAFLKQDYKTNMKKISFDILIVLGLSILTLLIAALIEVYITPLI